MVTGGRGDVTAAGLIGGGLVRGANFCGNSRCKDGKICCMISLRSTDDGTTDAVVGGGFKK